MLRNPSKTFFNFLAQIRKLPLNIGGYSPDSDYTKIGVTEKSYDFVTFSHKTGDYFITIQYIQNHQKIKSTKTCKSLYWINIRKGKEDPK
ncbi:hypothetical protein C6497_01620 [Candidatus Poribacteria bacterium]|nr:MAG: hypothetical protein C6497_01620 [Candidatus Poribacteria bacterium]